MKKLFLSCILIVNLFANNISIIKDDILIVEMNKYLNDYTKKTKCLEKKIKRENYSYCKVYNKVDDYYKMRFSVYKLIRKDIFNYIYCDEKDKRLNRKTCFIEEKAMVSSYDFFKTRTIGLKQDGDYIYELAYEPN